MGEIASASQLRMSFVRWALVLVPFILLLGTVSGIMSNSGYDNSWFSALRQPDLMPPGWVFGVVWTILYILMGISLALIMTARGARGRTVATALFVVQLILNLAWSPVFFAAHQVTIALAMIVIMIVLVAAVVALFCTCQAARSGASAALSGLALLCGFPQFSGDAAESRCRDPCTHRRRYPNKLIAR